MGAFALIKKDSGVDVAAVKNCFKKKGFIQEAGQQMIGEYSLLYYPKMKTGDSHFQQLDSGAFIAAFGTFVYQSMFGQEALRAMAKDLSEGSFDVRAVIGDFAVVWSKEKSRIELFTSPAYTYDLFFDAEQRIISSSFLAVCEGVPGNLSINRQAFVEVMLTGNLIPPDTLFKEVTRLARSVRLRGAVNHEPIPSKAREELEKGRKIPSFRAAVKDQLDQLEAFFSSAKPLLNQMGACIGLTGGFDSRLLLGTTMNAGVKPKVYTTWRKNNGREFSTAEMLSNALDLNLNFLQHRSIFDMEEREAKRRVEDNFWFNDGQVRTHNLWTEEIKSREYLLTLVGDQNVNTSGVGGEQYRNGERKKKSVSFSDWVQYELLLKYNDNPFDTQKSLNEAIDYLKLKIRKELDLDGSDRLDFLSLKRYYNEIYNPANRTLRNNIENQLYYFLSPFAEWQLSQAAYRAIPWLGRDFEFEKEMICATNRRAAVIPSDYGFAPSEKIPMRQRLGTVLKSNMPESLFWKLYRRTKKNSDFLPKLENKFSFVRPAIDLIEDLDLKIDHRKAAQSAFLAPICFELGFLLSHYSSKIRA